ncbi:hypothetical protein CDAR_433071 [Caerostris darwini]|uniref:Uncharacterized protein n=1 Tax=Caerostris darwini TaxID=1538125 RepID=A0AAV4QMA1_9ARAC|nr:hypothetical protein CDAR_433071 [Caerostris darwini]
MHGSLGLLIGHSSMSTRLRPPRIRCPCRSGVEEKRTWRLHARTCIPNSNTVCVCDFRMPATKDHFTFKEVRKIKKKKASHLCKDKFVYALLKDHPH